MDDKDFEFLIESGFNKQQINQMLNLNQYVNIEAQLVNGISPEIEIDILRSLNRLFRKYNFSYNEIDHILRFAAKNLDPALYVELDGFQKETMFQILKQELFYKIYPEAKPNIDFDLVHKCVLYPNVNKDVAFLIKMDIMSGIDVTKYIKPEYNEAEINVLREFVLLDKEKYIPKLDPGIIETLHCNKDLYKIINSYSSRQKDLLVSILINGFDINKYILEKGQVDLAFCKKMQDMKLDNDIIEKYLDQIKFFCDSDWRWERLIKAKNKGYEIEKYFDRMPNLAELEVLKILVDEGIEENRILNFINFFKEYFQDDLYELNNVDILKYLELYEDGYDISKICEQHMQSYFINRLKFVCDETGLDFQYLLLKEFNSSELSLFYKCVDNNRMDILNTVLRSKDCNRYICGNINEILDNDLERGTKTNITRLFYDKGNDIFNDFNPAFEFNVHQKELLTNAIARNLVKEEDLDIIRDNKIDWEKLGELLRMMKEGLNLSSFIDKVNDLDHSDIVKIHLVMNLGFDIVER